MPDSTWPVVGVIGKLAETRVPGASAPVGLVRPFEPLLDENDVALTDESDEPLTG
jgi:hypothetical protein